MLCRNFLICRLIQRRVVMLRKENKWIKLGLIILLSCLWKVSTKTKYFSSFEIETNIFMFISLPNFCGLISKNLWDVGINKIRPDKNLSTKNLHEKFSVSPQEYFENNSSGAILGIVQVCWWCWLDINLTVTIVDCD